MLDELKKDLEEVQKKMGDMYRAMAELGGMRTYLEGKIKKLETEDNDGDCQTDGAALPS